MGRDRDKREKNRKHLYTRSEKLWRGKQLGTGYGRGMRDEGPEDDGPLGGKLKVLFVCSRNQWRSPTAERMWRKHPALEVRSGGTSRRARHSVTAADIAWADVVFGMEEKHKSRLLAAFPRLLAHKPLYVLDIPDEYGFMDPALVEELDRAVTAILSLGPND